MDVAEIPELKLYMSANPTSDQIVPKAIFRWIVSSAKSFNQDYGPDLIAVRMDDFTVAMLRAFLENLSEIVARYQTVVRLQFRVGRVEFLVEDENVMCADGELGSLTEGNPIMLPPGVDLPRSCLEQSEDLSEFDSLTLVIDGAFAAPRVFASARIKHTTIEVESTQDLWPLIAASFPTVVPSNLVQFGSNQSQIATS